ncbi:hypothetical protein SAMN04488005_0738 [Yoonia tamlensis]|uniref:Uncharacterized protein n=1 Tax=Yoonia tamlensis TaxID=390270 RepID=A0A1I6FYF1_9RHOB|nr:hypothetical protein [Yoonia tamlensis]SFR34969.1 hypothetical protein SAMN04488005_0738 [Yoonia tamlensis]
MTSRLKMIAKNSLSVLAVSTLVLTSATAAFAERGGNGNGNGNGNSNGNGNNSSNSAEARNNGNNGRGELARELRGLNAAHANANALANAAPNSMPGRLNGYKLAQESAAQANAVETAAQDEYDRLIGLTEEEIAAQYPEGGYEDAVLNAAQTLQVASDDAAAAQAIAAESLVVLTDGRVLSDAAMAELHRLLGL